MRIIVTFKDGTDTATARQIVRDAMGEFSSHRRHDGVDSYVRKRYATMAVGLGSGYDEWERAKIEEVQSRISLADSADIAEEEDTFPGPYPRSVPLGPG